MRSSGEFIFSILAVIAFVIIYITNFAQMIIAISDDNWNLAIIKALGVFTFLGSFITVWF